MGRNNIDTDLAEALFIQTKNTEKRMAESKDVIESEILKSEYNSLLSLLKDADLYSSYRLWNVA